MKSRPGNVRSVAARVVDWALSSGRPVDGLIHREEEGLTSRDRGLFRELVLGTLRWLRRLDFVIEKASSREMRNIDALLRAPLRLATYQILFLDRIPPHAAVDEAVTEARRRTHRRGAGFVNAVLRQIARAPQMAEWPVEESSLIRQLAIETSHPDLLVDRWLGVFGEQKTRDMLATNNRPKPWQILTFKERGGRDLTAGRLAEEGVETTPSTVAPMGLVVTDGNPLSTSSFRDGTIYLQDVASQAAALVPLPTEPERVVDLAAAPGGKSFTLQSWNASLEIWAADRSWQRLRILRENRDRLDLRIRLLQADTCHPPLRAAFDRVVLDLPCSGTGTLRKNPELKWRIDKAEIQRLGRQGLEMVHAGAHLVRPGGILSVVTCSLEPEENSQVVSRFLEKSGDFRPMHLKSELPEPLASWADHRGGWQIMPKDVHDGFTVHVLQRHL